MSRRSGLGRGLGALIPAEVKEDHAAAALVDVPITSIRPNPHQPRRHFDDEGLQGLTASIKELGVLQPVLVRRLGDDDYELIAGERRWRSAKRAGLASIPAVVRSTSDLASLEQALVENLHREDLSPLEEAAAYQQLIEDFGLTHDLVATRVGRSRTAVTNTLRLFQLPPSVQRLVGEGHLAAGHARALLGTPDRAYQELLARQAVDAHLSVRAVEEAVRAHNDERPADGDGLPVPALPQPPAVPEPAVLELEELLADHLDTRVAIELGGRRGRVVVEFADLADLERIYRAMTEPTPSGQGDDEDADPG